MGVLFNPSSVSFDCAAPVRMSVQAAEIPRRTDRRLIIPDIFLLKEVPGKAQTIKSKDGQL